MRSLADVADLISGQHVPTAKVNQDGVGVPYLTGPSDFDGPIPTPSHWTEEGLRFCSSGDILITVKGSGCGSLAMADRTYAISRQLMAIRPTQVDVHYLWCVLQCATEVVRRKMQGLIPGLSRPQILELPIPRPVVGNEAQVASVMNFLQKHDQLLLELCSQKKRLGRGLRQRLLTGKKRFPAFRSRAWPSSELGDHVKPVRRKNEHGCELVLTASGEHGLVAQREYFNRNVAGADLSGYYALRRGEFAYNRSAMSGYPYGATKRLDAYDEGVLSTLYLCFAIDDAQLDSNFLRHLFDSGVLNRQLRRIVRVGARAHGLLNVTDDDFFAVQIPFPELDEQKAIAGVLDDLGLERNMLEEQRQQYALYKRGLMQRLLSGEIQVPV